jgi:hypothetical protein
MSKKLNEILAAADWKELTRRLLYYADNLIRQSVWNGKVVIAKPGAKICVEGLGADDLSQEAIDRFLSGRRAYNYSVSLEQNLKGAVHSIVWSITKSSQRKPFIESSATQPSGHEGDPLDRVESPVLPSDCSAIAKENAATQSHFLDEFERSLVGEDELLKLLNAYKREKTKPREIETITGIAASRVSELKRKLRTRIQQFEVQQFRS